MNAHSASFHRDGIRAGRNVVRHRRVKIVSTWGWSRKSSNAQCLTRQIESGWGWRLHRDEPRRLRALATWPVHHVDVEGGAGNDARYGQEHFRARNRRDRGRRRVGVKHGKCLLRIGHLASARLRRCTDRIQSWPKRRWPGELAVPALVVDDHGRGDRNRLRVVTQYGVAARRRAQDVGCRRAEGERDADLHRDTYWALQRIHPDLPIATRQPRGRLRWAAGARDE